MRRAATVALALALVGVAAPSATAGTTTSFTMTSPHVRDAVGVSVLLPAGYDPARATPVLYLLHGFGETHAHWSAPSRGDVARVAQGLRAIVVMPDQRMDFSIDHFNAGTHADPAWTRFFFESLVPEIERRYRVRPGRRWRAIAGASMGGYGAVTLASLRPGYFGAVASLSGLLEIQRPPAAAVLRAQGVDYERMLGPADGAYATAHNPPQVAGNLRHTRVLAINGDGVPDLTALEAGTDYPVDRAFLLGTGAVTERILRGYRDAFASRAAAAGVGVHVRTLRGVHDWPDFRQQLSAALAWNLFAAVDERPASWRVSTIRNAGRAWHVSYALAAGSQTPVTLAYHRGRLTGTGGGTMTIRAGACSFTTRLPFARTCRPSAATLRAQPIRRRDRP